MQGLNTKSGHKNSKLNVRWRLCPQMRELKSFKVNPRQKINFFFKWTHDIFQGLKKNWEELHHQYQGLSVVTDTAPKKNRKERMEAEMKQLERDIEMIEKHDAIFIE